jgi:RNAse (barnase) inhibitor barstar
MVEQLSQASDGVLETGQSVKETIRELRDAGYFAVLVDRAPVFNKETLLHALYQSCVFPAYFGFNWDALEDILKTDWLESSQTFRGYVLVFRNFSVLEERAENVAKTFLDSVQDVAKVRLEKDRIPLYVVWAKG